MGTLKAVFGVIGALVGLVYCFGLAYYFLDKAGSVEAAETVGLGPTLLGLGGVGLLFIILLMVRIARLFPRPPTPGSGGPRGRSTSAPDDDRGIDADAVVARYMASRSTDAPAAPLARGGGEGPARPQSFGRRNR